jgi:hypothetical protein
MQPGLNSFSVPQQVSSVLHMVWCVPVWVFLDLQGAVVHLTCSSHSAGLLLRLPGLLLFCLRIWLLCGLRVWKQALGVTKMLLSARVAMLRSDVPTCFCCHYAGLRHVSALPRPPDVASCCLASKHVASCSLGSKQMMCRVGWCSSGKCKG